MDKPVILFPSDYFDKQAVDKSFAGEYDAASKTPTLEVALFDLTQFEEEGLFKINSNFEASPLLVYRGWMMKPHEYGVFYEELVSLGAKPLTTPKQYANLHLFPHVYPAIQADTPGAIMGDEGGDWYETVTHAFSRFMLKDYVKSVKGTEFPTAIDSAITREEFAALLERFQTLRGDLFTDGLVFKEYVELKKRNERTNEWRVFYLNKAVLNVERNSGQDITSPRPPQELIEKYTTLNSPYYTVDYAERESGDWTIIETGDGQVSGLASEQNPALYYAILGEALNQTA